MGQVEAMATVWIREGPVVLAGMAVRALAPAAQDRALWAAHQAPIGCEIVRSSSTLPPSVQSDIIPLLLHPHIDPLLQGADRRRRI